MTVTENWREVSPYLDVVLELEPAARQSWLEQMSARDPEAAARVGKYLLSLEQLEKDRFLDTPAALLSEATLAGEGFGAYTLDRLLGHGGTGTVWLAHRSDGQFEGQAAVKLLNPALVGHPSAQRFSLEASVLARLQHPNIAHLLDAGVEGGTQPYLVLEYVKGSHIDRYCESRRLDVEARIRLFLNVLSAVAHAHSNLIVHRDLKPSNILVAEDGTVKLLDFGISALLSADEGAGVHLTRNAAACLTLGYASPEQLRAEPITTASDVYALGLVLFLLLTGRHPLAPDGKTAAELMKITLEADVPQPSDVATDVEGKRRLRGDLDNIIAMALRRNPAERYTSVDHFAQDLRRYLAFKPISARPRSWGYLARMFLRRHTVAVAVGVLVLVVLVTAVAVTRVQMLEARDQRDRARLQSRTAAASRDLLDLLVMSEFGTKGAPQTWSDRLERGVAMILKQYRSDPRMAGRMLVQMGADFRDNARFDRANELFQQGYELGQSVNDSEVMAYAQCERALGQAYGGMREGLTERLAETRRLLARIDHPDPDLLGLCALAESTYETKSGHPQRALEILQASVRRVEEEDATDQRIYSSLISALAAVYLDLNRPAEALKYWRLTGATHERDGRGASADRLVSLQNEASALHVMGEFREALGVRENVLERVRAQGEAEEVPPVTWVFYGTALTRLARPAEGLKAIEGVMERIRASGSPFMISSALIARAEALVQLRLWDEAETALLEAESVTDGGKAVKGTTSNVEVVRLRSDVARGQLESAHAHVAAVLRRSGYRTSDPARRIPTVLLLAARIALAERENAKAEQLAREALVTFEGMARGPDTSADVGEALLYIASAQRAANPRADVAALVQRAVRCLTNGLGAEHPLTVEARSF